MLTLPFLTGIPLSLMIGIYPVPAVTVVRILRHLLLPRVDPHAPAWTQAELLVVAVIRLSRVGLPSLAGMVLGLAGATPQGLFPNPLVGPDIIGISAGSAFGAVAGIALSTPMSMTIAFAFGGGMLALGAAAGIATLGRTAGTLGVVLAGVIVFAFFSALVGLIQYLVRPETQLPGIVYLVDGQFCRRGPRQGHGPGNPGAGRRHAVDLAGLADQPLSLQDSDARALGVPVAQLRWGLIGVVSVMVAAHVSVSGTVGWIGLVAPHLARLLVGPDHRRLLLASAVLGGGFALLADDLARSLTDQELPVGLLTAIVGTPVFAIMFWRAQGKGWYYV